MDIDASAKHGKFASSVVSRAWTTTKCRAVGSPNLVVSKPFDAVHAPEEEMVAVAAA